MRHFTSPRFWKHYGELPANVRRLAGKNLDLLKRNPQHPTLHFRRIGRFWSVRAGVDHRALAVEGPQGLIWFWIGTHAEYDKLLQAV